LEAFKTEDEKKRSSPAVLFSELNHVLHVVSYFIKVSYYNTPMKIFYSPNKHGRRINNQNNTITWQTKKLEAYILLTIFIYSSLFHQPLAT